MYVTNFLNKSVSVIDASNNTVVGKPISLPEVSSYPWVDNVTMIETSNNTVVRNPIPLPDGMLGSWPTDIVYNSNNHDIMFRKRPRRQDSKKF